MKLNILILDNDPISSKRLHLAVEGIQQLDIPSPLDISIHSNNNLHDAINTISCFNFDIIIINISSIDIENHLGECIQLKNIYSFAPIIAISESIDGRLDQYSYIGLDDILSVRSITAPILYRVMTSAIQRYKNFNSFHSVNHKKLVSNQLLKLLLKKKSLREVASDACHIIHSQSLKSESSTASIYLIIDSDIVLIAHSGHEESAEEIALCKQRLAVLIQEDARLSAEKKDEFRYYKSGNESEFKCSRITIPLKKEGTTFAFLKIKTDYDIVHPSEAHLYYRDIATSLSDVLKLAQERIHFDQLNKQNIRLIDEMSSAVIGIDIHDSVTHWNNQSELYFGVKQNQAVGQKLSDLNINCDWELIADNIKRCINNNAPTDRFNATYKRKDEGSARILSISITPFIETNGAFTGYLLLLDDITEKNHMEKQHQQSMYLESIGQLSAGIAHEINTPMQYISDNLNFLKDSYNETNRALRDIKKALLNNSLTIELLESIFEEADLEYLSKELPLAFEQTSEGVDRVCTIIKAMKEYSHPTSDKKTKTDINKCIESTVIISKHTWKYHAEMILELDPELKPVMCYPGPFNEVILNIIVNAADAIKEQSKNDNNEKGEIKIETIGKEDVAEIRISDTGGGIPESIQEKIFDPFFTTKEVGKGTGQGLALSYRIIKERHNGEMFFETVPGVNTVFIIQLAYE